MVRPLIDFGRLKLPIKAKFCKNFDSSSNIYVVGNAGSGFDGNTGQGNTDVLLVKFNSSGTKQWSRLYGGTAGDIGRGIAIDNSGNLFLTGWTSGSIDNNTVGKESSGGGDTLHDYFILKYNSSGTKQ